MKIVWLLLLISFSGLSHAQLLKRQSLLSLQGLVEMILDDRIPYPDYQTDFSSPIDLENMEILAHSSELRSANLESTFTFLNDNESFKGIFKKDLGVCRGYASLRRKFRHLAFFDPNNESAQEIPNPDTNPKEFKKFYRKLVKKIRQGEPTKIPGFENLRAMSSHPLLNRMLKWQVYHEWRRKNYSKKTGTEDMLIGAFKKTPYEQMLEVRSKVEAYSNLNLNTIMWITVAKSTWIHVLEAVKVSPVEEDGSFKFVFWNDKYLEIDRAYSTLEVLKTGEMIYEDGLKTRTIHAAGIAEENDGELRHFAEGLKDFFDQQSPHISLQ